jgi:hypothetical protein
MTEADDIKLDRLCSVCMVEVAGAFIRTASGDQPDETLTQNVLQWLDLEKSLERVERVVNHVHIYDEFDGLQEDEYDEIAVRVFLSWNSAVKQIDPSLRVEKYEDYGPTLTLYKRREA